MIKEPPPVRYSDTHYKKENRRYFRKTADKVIRLGILLPSVRPVRWQNISVVYRISYLNYGERCI